MPKYICPYQYRHAQHRFLMCKRLLEHVERIQDPIEAVKAYCPYQKHCSCTARAENTEEAILCYEKHKNQTALSD